MINTEKHPEFIWLTWEHKSNAPNCTDPQPTPENGWSQEYAWGTDPGSETNGNDNDTNRRNIQELNQQLVGPGGYVTQVADMAIWQSYQMVGGLWTNGGVPSGGTDVQRGSLELANTTMETFFQQPSRNCFTCHNYTTESPLDVSHIIDDLLPASETGD